MASVIDNNLTKYHNFIDKCEFPNAYKFDKCIENKHVNILIVPKNHQFISYITVFYDGKSINISIGLYCFESILQLLDVLYQQMNTYEDCNKSMYVMCKLNKYKDITYQFMNCNTDKEFYLDKLIYLDKFDFYKSQFTIYNVKSHLKYKYRYWKIAHNTLNDTNLYKTTHCVKTTINIEMPNDLVENIILTLFEKLNITVDNTM